MYLKMSVIYFRVSIQRMKSRAQTKSVAQIFIFTKNAKNFSQNEFLQDVSQEFLAASDLY